MTVFEKIKEMDQVEMVEFLNIIGDVDFFANNYCGNLCKRFAGCRYGSSNCITSFDYLLEIRGFLREDYEKFLEDSKNGKKCF